MPSKPKQHRPNVFRGGKIAETEVISRTNSPERPSAARRGYDRTWQKVRLMQLRRQPTCEVCGRAADQVHHIEPIRDRPELRLDFDNLISICASCHSSITRRAAGRGGSNL